MITSQCCVPKNIFCVKELKPLLNFIVYQCPSSRRILLRSSPTYQQSTFSYIFSCDSDFKTSDQPTRTDFQFELTVAFLNNFRRTFLNPYSMNVSEPTHESASNTVELSRNHSSSEHDDSDTSQRSQLDTPETTLKIIAEDEMCCGESDDEHFIDLESLANNSSSRISFSLAESSECLESSEFSTDNNSSREMQIEGENQAPETLVSKSYVKIVIGILLLLIICFVIVDSVFGKMYISMCIRGLLDWMRENSLAGMAAYIVVYVVATIFCVPGALLTLGAGFVFTSANDGSLLAGLFIGTLAVFIGSSTGAIIAFFLARYLLHERVRKLSQRYSIFEALDVALSEKGLRIMCLLRLSPITPFVLLNYIAGVTTVTFKNYTISLLCMLPGMALYIFLGASAGSLTDKTENQTVTIIAVTLGVIFGGLAIFLTSHYARKELNKEVDLVRNRLYSRATSRVNRNRLRIRSLRRKRSKNRLKLDRKRLGI